MYTLYVVCLFFSTRLELHPYALLWWLYVEWVKASLVCCNKKKHIFKKSATNFFYFDFLLEYFFAQVVSFSLPDRFIYD